MTGNDYTNLAYLTTILLFVGYGMNLWRTARALARRDRLKTGRESRSGH